MRRSARLYFTLLRLANLHFSFQCISVNSSKFNSICISNKNVSICILCTNVSKCIKYNNVHINVSNKECSNIDLKLGKKKNNKMRERKKVPFINFFV